MSHVTMLSLRLVAAYGILSAFFFFFLVSGLSGKARNAFVAITADPVPDFSHYREFQTLTDVQFPIGSYCNAHRLNNDSLP